MSLAARHRALAQPPRGASDRQPLFTMSNISARPEGRQSNGQSRCYSREAPLGVRKVSVRRMFHHARAALRRAWEVVELNGIEPMTSCLQSTRSPN